MLKMLLGAVIVGLLYLLGILFLGMALIDRLWMIGVILQLEILGIVVYLRK